MTEIVKGFKVTNSEMQCRGYQYELNKEFTHKGNVSPCDSGFHFCEVAADCFSYYDFKPSNRVFEIEASGKMVTDGNKTACSKIKFIREIPWDEVLRIVNSGSANTGLSNSGYSNSGYRNSGNWNSGDRNSGDSNSGYRSAGAFCASPNPIIFLFDKPTNMTAKEWENTRAFQIMSNLLEHTIWVPDYAMTDQEKKDHPKYETTEGYLKTIPLKEAWGNMWPKLDDESKKAFTDLPNFSWDIFTQITGIEKC